MKTFSWVFTNSWYIWSACCSFRTYRSINHLSLLKNKRPTWCHLLFYLTSYVLNMFRTLIYPSSGACDYSVELPHWSIVLGSMCVGVSVWLGWSGIHTHQTKNNTTNVVIQQNSRKLLMMDMLMSETCWAHKMWNKIASDIKLLFYSSPINNCVIDGKILRRASMGLKL